MTQAQQQAAPPHPFDLEKSDFEKLLDRDLSFGRIEEAVADAQEAQTKDHLRRAVYLARAQDHMRRELDSLEWVIMPLMGTRMGFKIDKKVGRNPQNEPIYPYTWEIVKDCVLEALLSGANLTGNEFNIISGGPYLTKEFFERKLNELCGGEQPRMVNFIEAPSVPRVSGGSAIVEYTANGVFDGVPFNYTRSLAIKVNDGQGPDAILGKAKRKMFKWLLETLTRSSFGPDADTGEEMNFSAPGTPATPSRTAEVARGIEQAQQQAAKKAPAAPEPPAPANPTPPAAGGTTTPTNTAPAATRGALGRRPQAKQEPKPEPKPEPKAPEPDMDVQYEGEQEPDQAPQDAPAPAPLSAEEIKVKAKAFSQGDLINLTTVLAAASVNPHQQDSLNKAKEKAKFTGLVKEGAEADVRRLAFFFHAFELSRQ